MKDHLIFDTTDAQTIADSDSVGAFVRAGTDGTLIGHVSDALKVNFSNTTIAVTATDLDIRDLVYTQDSVTAYQGTSPWVIGDGGSSISIDDNGGSITVDGSVSISGTVAVTQSTSPWIVQAGAEHAEDSAHVSGDIGNFMLAVRNDANSALAADGDYHALTVDNQGRLKVAAEVTVQAGDAEYLEDSAHVSGDAGLHMLAVRQDTLAASVSADGDYASLKVNANGALYVDIASSSGTLTVSDAALANTALAHAANVLDTADTAEVAIASALANRKYLWIYNNDNTKVFIGGSGVTTANGFPVSPGSYLELRAGASISPYFVGQSGKTPEIRTLELS